MYLFVYFLLRHLQSAKARIPSCACARYKKILDTLEDFGSWDDFEMVNDGSAAGFVILPCARYFEAKALTVDWAPADFSAYIYKPA